MQVAFQVRQNICKRSGVSTPLPAHILDWFKREAGTIYVGLVHLGALQQSEIATKIANPKNLVAVCQLNPSTKKVSHFK